MTPFLPTGLYIIMDTYRPDNALVRSVVERVPFGFVVIGRSGKVLMSNQPGLSYLGIHLLPDEIHRQDLLPHLSRYEAVCEVIASGLEQNLPPTDLPAIDIEGRAVAIKIRAIPTGGLIIASADITSEKQLELTAMKAMIAGQELERQRISGEIHDGTGPLISAIRLHLEAIKGLLAAHDTALSKIEVVTDLVNQAAQDLRNLSHDLMPRGLSDLGLRESLAHLVQQTNATGKVKVHFFHAGFQENLPIPMRLPLYRCAQELLNNALKHSQAQQITIQIIRHENESITLMVEDDGVGFDPALVKTKNAGIGLQNVQTRVKMLGGSMDIDSGAGRGSIITLEIPLTWVSQKLEKPNIFDFFTDTGA